jgi:multidrug efflux pump subunit AcrA (membrane-fusion protein)
MFKRNRSETFKVKVSWLAAMGLGLLLALESFCSFTAFADDPVNQAAQPKEFYLGGKLSCSLKRNAVMPFKGVFTKLIATAGLKVKQGDVLAQYRLPPDVVLQIRRRLSPPQIADLEIGLNDVEKGLSSLGVRYNEARNLMAQNMASEQSLAQVESERRLLTERQAALQQRIAQERQFARDDTLALKEQLGVAFAPNHVPEVVSLLAPIAGQVISINTEVREGAEVAPGLPAFTIGTTDPMIMKTQVFEADLVQFKIGDPAEITVESLPNRKFEAKISRITLTPINPGLGDPSYYELEFSVSNPDLTLKDGLKALACVRKPK